MSQQLKQIYEFGPFRLDATERILLREGELVPLPLKAFETLLALIERRGHVIDKDELMQKVWPDTFVEEGNLAKNISALRKILSNGNGAQDYIETIPKRGYRFVAQVKELSDGPMDLIVAERVRAHIATEEEEDDSSSDSAALPFSPQQALPPSTSQPGRAWRRRKVIFLVIGLLLVAGGAITFYYWLRANRTQQAEVEVKVKSLAVLPFKFVGAEKEDEYLGVGLTYALTTQLGNLRQVVVRPTSAVMKYRDKEQDAVAAGRALGVDAVLEGRVQKFGERISVRWQLVSVQDGTLIWGGDSTHQFSDILLLQDSISHQIVRALALTLTGKEQEQLAKHYTENTEAYNSYLRGRVFWDRRGADWANKAIASFEQAIKLDPNYALAYAGLADTYIVLGDHGTKPSKEAFPQAREAALRALAIDETLAEAHASLAHVKARFDWDWPGAEAECKRAIDLNPNYALAYGWYGIFLNCQRRFDEALAVIRQAQEIDPVSPSLFVYASATYLRAGQPDQAIEQARKALDLDPDFVTAYPHLGQAYEQKGMYQEAIAAFNRAHSLGIPSQSLLGHVYAVAGKRQEALKLLDELKALSAQRYLKPYGFAVIYVGLGEHEKALEWLNRAIEDHDTFASNLATDARFNPLRSDPRFVDLLRRVGLPK